MPRQLNNRSIADNAINSDKIEAGAVDAADLANGSITSAKIADGAITSGKLAETYLTTDGDGSQLTGIESFTKSSSDPSYNTNATLGDVWINTTSGEVFVCTNATTNENVWTNAKGSGHIDFPIASTITANYNLNTALGPSTVYDITFSNASDSIDTEFAWSISDISDVNVIDSAQPADDAYGTSATFTFTMGSTINTPATFNVNIEDSDGYISTKQFGITATQQTYSVDYLLVAGGGGTAQAEGYSGANGGAGAGGMLESSADLTPGTQYTITVGSGGTATDKYTVGNNGSDSTLSGSGFTTITAYGGGGGPDYGSNAPSGGCGGGGSENYTLGGSGTSGQGYPGGNGSAYTTGGGGGGGGTGGGGYNAAGYSNGAPGGIAASSSILGTTYGVGGKGAPPNTYTTSSAGGANTGNGATGAGASGGSEGSGANGGSGIAALKILTSDYTGTYSGSPSVSISGSYTILTYTSTGTYTA